MITWCACALLLQGLRLHDNPALLEACRQAQHVYPVFIIDPFFLKNGTYK
jgi:cryptochrome